MARDKSTIKVQIVGSLNEKSFEDAGKKGAEIANSASARATAGGKGLAMSPATHERLFQQNVEQSVARLSNASLLREQNARVENAGRATFVQSGGVLNDARAMREAAEVRKFVAMETATRKREDAEFEVFKAAERARKSLGFTGSKDGPSLEDMQDAVTDAHQKRNKIQGKEKAEADAVAFLNRSVVIAAVAVAATRAAGAIADSGYNYKRFSDIADQSQAGGFGREIASRQTGNQFIRDTLGGIPIIGGALASLTGVNADDYRMQQQLAGHKSIFDLRYSNLSRSANMGGDPVEALRLDLHLRRQAEKPALDQQASALASEDRERYGEGWAIARRIGKGKSSELARQRNRRDVLDAEQVSIAGEKFSAGLSASHAQGLMGSQSALSIQESLRGNNLMAFGRQMAIERMGFESESKVSLAGLRGEPLAAEQARIKGAREQMMAQQSMQMQMFVGSNPEAQQASFVDFMGQGQLGALRGQQNSKMEANIEAIVKQLELISGTVIKDSGMSS